MDGGAMKIIGRFVRAAAAIVFGALSVGASAGTVTYFHNDLAGSPVVATDATGKVIWRESYRPYGERIKNEPGSADNKVWFTSRRQDVETGLVYMGARYYDPVIGRFISVDAAEFSERNIATHNRYMYANDNPYRYLDPNGMWSTSVHHKIIDAAFPNWSSRERGFIKGGSDRVDSALNQVPGVGNSYEHAMSDPGQSAGDAEKRMWQFVEQKLTDYKHYLYEANDERRAWESLGEALHPIMDSTSPSHSGFQVWKWTGGTPKRHGDFKGSEEGSISPEALQRTVDLIRRVMNGERQIEK